MKNQKAQSVFKTKRSSLLLLSGLAALSGEAPVALAQSGVEGRLLEEVVVSARRREESLIAVPVAASAVSGEQLRQYAIVDIRDISKLVPSLSIDRSTSGAGGVITMRGIGTSPSNAGFDQAVSLNIDGVQTGRARVIALGMLDVQQVEIMRGPQALFFGKNSPAGVISLTSAAPTDTFEASVRAGYEFEAEEIVTEAMVSGPVTDSLSARVALRYRDMEGWLKNTAGQLTSSPFAGPDNLPQAPATDSPGEEEFIGRLSLAYQPAGSRFDATLKIAGMTLKDDGPSAGQQVINCQSYGAPAVVYGGIPTVAIDPFGDCKLDDKYSNGALPNGYADNWPLAKQNPYSDYSMNLISLTANYEWDNVKLTSVTGTFSSDTKYFDNYDATVYMAYDSAEHEEYESISQELRLFTSFDSPVNYLLGVYYQETELDFTNTVLIAPLPVDAATGKYHTWEKPGATDGETISAFAQLIWDVTDQVELAAGVRYTDESKDSFITNSYAHPILDGTVVAETGKIFSDKFSDENVSPEVTLTWRPTENLTGYIAYKTGYKSGGFGVSTNLIPATITADEIRFDSEEIEGYEAGIKARFLDNRLTVTSAVYNFKYTDLQVNAFDAATTSFKISNAASARVRGFEIDFTAAATDWLTLNGGIAFNEAFYLDYLSACYGGQSFADGCSVDNGNGTFSQQRKDDPLARAPEWAGNLGFSLDMPAGDDFLVGLSGNARYSDGYNGLDNGNTDGMQDSYWLFDMSLRFGPANENWELSLIGRNLSDESYAVYIAEKPGSPIAAGEGPQIMGLASRGRQLMVQATYRF